MIKSFIAITVVACLFGMPSFADNNTDALSSEELPIRGVNFAGPEFAGHKLPGTVNKDYVFPSSKDIKTYSEFGFELIRLPFKWERLQPSLEQSLDTPYLKNISNVVIEAAKYDMRVVLDVHNYGTYKSSKIGSDQVTQQAFNDLWFRLALHFKDNENVIFGIMNEPNKHTPIEWFPIAQGALTTIRDTGAKQKILVPSTYWSNAHRFTLKDGLYSNADLLKHIQDTENNFAFEVHTYFDHDNSGTNKDCPKDNIGVKRLENITQWLKDNNFEAFLGEFGSSENQACLVILDETLAYMDDNKDVWLGWSYWGASPWFGDYMYNVYPPDVETNPQAKILKTYLDKK